MLALTPRAQADFEALQQRHPTATLTEFESGAALVAVPVKLLPGWSVGEVLLRFLVPNGYPVAQPDSFWVEPDLTVNGKVPKNSQAGHPIPETTLKGHYFSWHVEQGRWSANSDSLITWLSSCVRRLSILE